MKTKEAEKIAKRQKFWEDVEKKRAEAKKKDIRGEDKKGYNEAKELDRLTALLWESY